MFLLLVSFGIIICLEVPKLFKDGYWRELVAFSVFMLAAFVICILFIEGLPIFNPIDIMNYVVRELLHLNYY